MEPNPSSAREVGRGYAYVALGCTFAGGVVLFAGVGLFLDRWLGWTPALTVVGTLMGAGLSFYNVYLKLQAEERAEKKPGPP